MKPESNFIKTTLVGGILYLVPVVVVLLVVGKAIQMARQLIAPISHRLDAISILGFDGARIASILLVLVLCFLAGLFSRTPAARASVRLLETA